MKNVEDAEMRKTEVSLYLVGGCVRDMIMGNPNPKDVDFAVEAKSFDHMRQWMVERGFHIHAETPKYFTLRAKAPKSGFSFAGRDYSGKDFDFALCRTDGEYKDGRHPDSVEVGTIHTDLSRRDFTMNAIAMDASGAFLDPFGGVEDIGTRTIRCVGSVERLVEDGLRVMRALRFAIQLDFFLDEEVIEFLDSMASVMALHNVDPQRIQQEMTKSMRINTYATMGLLYEYPMIAKYIFNETGIWLKPTDEKR